MVILPAIDIKDGKCVRLVQGKYDSAYTVAESAADTAKAFEAMGATWLHMVDLDGAKEAVPVNTDMIFDVLKQCNLKVELGGGKSATWKRLIIIWTMAFPASSSALPR